MSKAAELDVFGKFELVPQLSFRDFLNSPAPFLTIRLLK